MRMFNCYSKTNKNLNLHNMKTITVNIKSLFILPLFAICSAYGQCADESNVYSFEYDGRTYEVVKENKNWVKAAACAVEREGFLAEIIDADEQSAIFSQLSSIADVTNSNTTAPDGGGKAYVWIGGNDMSTEGNWIWDGNNDGTGTQFWMGTTTGSAVGGLYNNWGNEPDDYLNDQDGLAISLNGWPFGSAGQWNDVSQTNTLYYLIEYSTSLSTDVTPLESKIGLHPNPSVDFVQVSGLTDDEVSYIFYDVNGSAIKISVVSNNDKINTQYLTKGMHFLIFDNGSIARFVKE